MDLFHLVHVFARATDSDGGEGEVSDRHGGSLQRRHHLHTQGPISEHGQNISLDAIVSLVLSPAIVSLVLSPISNSQTFLLVDAIPIADSR